MGKVKTALEIALDRANNIGSLSSEEKKKIQDEEKISNILSEYFKGKIDANGLWQNFKEVEPSLLSVAQQKLIETISLNSLLEEIRSKKQAILAIESLKKQPDTVVIESSLQALEMLKKEYEEMKEKIEDDLKRHIEANPHLRMKQMRTSDGRIIQIALSVEDAVKARLEEFLPQHEEQYSNEFANILEELKLQVK